MYCAKDSQNPMQDSLHTKAQVAIVNERAGGNPELLAILQDNLRIAGDDKAFLTEYANALIAKGDVPGIMIQDGNIVDLQGAVYVHQFLDDVVRLPDTKPILKAIMVVNHVIG